MPQPQTQFEEILNTANANTANAALQSQDWPALRFNAQLMMRIDPQDETAWSYLGIANYRMGLDAGDRDPVQEGIEQTANATRLNPKSAMAWNNYGLTLVREGHYEDGWEATKLVTELDPHNIETLWVRMVAELNLGKFEEAQATFFEAAKRNSDSDNMTMVELRRLPHPKDVRSLAKSLVVAVSYEDGEFLVEENDFDACGRGKTLREALIDYGNYFEVLVEEYVETSDR